MSGGSAVVDERAERARRAIAAAVTESWTTIPHFAVSREIDATHLERRFRVARAANGLTTLTDLLLQAAGAATGQDTIGLSVATDRGVVNVTVCGALGDLERLAELRVAAVDRARRAALRKEDFAPVSTSLSNLGPQGAHWFTGIVPVGTHLLLTTGALRPAGERSLMWVTANADHRAIDGADAARVLERFAVHCDTGEVA